MYITSFIADYGKTGLYYWKIGQRLWLKTEDDVVKQVECIGVQSGMKGCFGTLKHTYLLPNGELIEGTYSHTPLGCIRFTKMDAISLSFNSADHHIEEKAEKFDFGKFYNGDTILVTGDMGYNTAYHFFPLTYSINGNEVVKNIYHVRSSEPFFVKLERDNTFSIMFYHREVFTKKEDALARTEFSSEDAIYVTKLLADMLNNQGNKDTDNERILVSVNKDKYYKLCDKLIDMGIVEILF